jgi:hypothetical protein
MARSITGDKKRRGRPATGIGKVIGLRWHQPELEALDAWAIDQKLPTPSRPEAIRRIVTEHLRRKGYLPKAK